MKFDSRHVDRFIAEDYIQHSTAASEGREGLRAFLDVDIFRMADGKVQEIPTTLPHGNGIF